mmetsp:Transcript_29434/g.61855  ORF Transcript_29434/g.61855 Transcript_29434/m.61855 type:complete len:371 (-) Transcript_29434:353-1465(-)
MEHNSDKESRLKPESNLQARKRASAGAHRTSRRSHGLYVERPVGDVLAKGVAREVLGALRNGLAPRLRRAEVHRPSVSRQDPEKVEIGQLVDGFRLQREVVAVPREAVEAAEAAAERQVVAREEDALAAAEAAVHQEAERAARVAGGVHDLDAGHRVPRTVASNLDLDVAHVDVRPAVGAAHVGRVHQSAHLWKAFCPAIVVGDVVHVSEQHQVHAAQLLEPRGQLRVVPRRVDHHVECTLWTAHQVRRRSKGGGGVVPEVEHVGDPLGIHSERKAGGSHVAHQRNWLRCADTAGRACNKGCESCEHCGAAALRLRMDIGLAVGATKGVGCKPTTGIAVYAALINEDRAFNVLRTWLLCVSLQTQLYCGH